MRISDVFKHRTIVWYSCLVIIIFMWDNQESNLNKYRPDRFSTKFTHTSPAPVLMTSILMYT
nr:MAG TPA: hypothetical protein [Caudoviricetes sp.]